jgi:hypothetical protein
MIDPNVGLLTFGSILLMQNDSAFDARQVKFWIGPYLLDRSMNRMPETADGSGKDEA